jgi:hypothetical protein
MAIQKKLPHVSKVTAIPKKGTIKTVNELKKKYRHLPLHFLFGIEKEIEHQCPSLDEYLEKIEEVKTALETIRKSKSIEATQIQAAIALHSMGNLSSDIDLETRCNFEKLRKSMEDWKQLALAAISETKNPEKFLKI